MRLRSWTRGSLPIATVIVALFAIAPSPRAEVILVSPGLDPNADLQAAVQAAASGDTLILMPGAWSFPGPIDGPVELKLFGKGLTVLAAPGTHPELWSAYIHGLSPGEQVVIRGIDFKTKALGFLTSSAVWVNGCAGPVWIEDSDIMSGDQASSGTIFGANPGLAGVTIWDSESVILVRCTLRGGKGANDFDSPFHPTPATGGGAGLLVDTSRRVTAFECVIQGGTGGLGGTLSPGAASGPGLAVATLSALGAGGGVTVAGGSVTGADSTGVAPGDGVLVGIAAPVWLRDVAVAAGTGVGSASDIDAPPGTVTLLPAPPRSLQMPATLHETANGTMIIDGVQGDLVALFASLKGALQFFPGKQGAFLLGSPLSASFVLGPNPVPGGHWSINFGAPSLPPAVQSVTVLLQLVVHDGTQVLFEGGSAITILDSALP